MWRAPGTAEQHRVNGLSVNKPGAVLKEGYTEDIGNRVDQNESTLDPDTLAKPPLDLDDDPDESPPDVGDPPEPPPEPTLPGLQGGGPGHGVTMPDH
jgi:hypothetical protein